VPLILILILLALVTESFATAWYSAAIHSKLNESTPIKLPAALALVKAVIIALGVFIGNVSSSTLPWTYLVIAYILMFIIGLKIVIENMRFMPEERIVLVDNNRTLFLLSLAGSFNSFFVALSLGLIGTSVLLPSLFTFIVTLFAAYTSLYLGKSFGLRPFLRISVMAGGALLAGVAIRFFITYFLN
jgi:putative Mn2+ efflux pump MntP